MNSVDIKKLSEMVRVDMTDEEINGISHDFNGILEYVGHVKEAYNLVKDSSETSFSWELKNIIREDIATDKPGEYADKIIDQMPDKEGRYLKVKKIL